MSREDRGAGPLVGQTVIYNYGTTSSPTLAPGIIYALGTSGSVNLLYATSSGWTNVTNKTMDPNLSGGTYAYPDFL